MLEKLVAAFKAKPAARPAEVISEPSAPLPVSVEVDEVPELVTDAVALIEENDSLKAKIADADTLNGQLVRQNAEMKAELARRDAEKAADAEKAKTVLETERKARIDAEVEAFTQKCANIGKEATTAMLARFRAAKTANDAAALKELETIVAAIPAPGPEGRLPEEGPTAEAIAERVKGGGSAAHFLALAKLAAQGVSQSDRAFTAKYQKALAEVERESGVKRGK